MVLLIQVFLIIITCDILDLPGTSQSLNDVLLNLPFNSSIADFPVRTRQNG